MKYTIETTDDGCIETLEFRNGKYTKRSQKTGFGCEALDEDFSAQLEKVGFCNVILDRVYDLYDGFGALNSIELAELEN